MSITITSPNGTTEEVVGISMGGPHTLTADKLAARELTVSDAEKRLERATLGLVQAGQRLREAIERQRAATLAVVRRGKP